MRENPIADAGDVVRQTRHGKPPIVAVSALGVVFGDIGTSPLYTFKTILGAAEKSPDASVVLGTLSLVLWTLFIITTVKYVSFAMRVDNGGEGGILALMALLGVKKRRSTIVAAGLLERRLSTVMERLRRRFRCCRRWRASTWRHRRCNPMSCPPPS